MAIPPAHDSNALILAIDDSTDSIGQALMRLSHDEPRPGRAMRGATMVSVGGAGDALRLIHRHEPHLLFVCVGPACVDASAALIEALRHRRPHLPLFAVAAEHDEAIERAVRAAGVSYYFALNDENNGHQLRDALLKLAIRPVAKHSGLSPPRPATPANSRGRPPARSRLGYGRSSFD